jgi:hypothetical protein
MNSENRHTSSRIGIRNWTMITFVPLPGCWLTLTVAPLTESSRSSVWVIAPEEGYADHSSSGVVETAVVVGLLAAVPPAPAVGVVEPGFVVTSTRLS